jgi:hypothetical protein
MTRLDKLTIIVLLFTVGGIMMVAFSDIAVATTIADITPLDVSTVETAFDRYFTILLFPVNNPAFVPSVVPLIAGLIVVAFYYGRYRNEELGWGAAVSNTLIMTTTGVILLYEIAPDAVTWQYLQTNALAVLSYVTGTSLADSGADPRFMVASGIIALGLVIITLDYYHLWPKHLAFFISSGFMVYTLAYLTIAIVYETLPVSTGTALASIGAIYTSLLFVRTLKVMSNTQDRDDTT